MHRRTLLAASAAAAATPLIRPARAQPATTNSAKTKIVWWHAMTAALGLGVNRLTDAFNASQNDVEVTPVYKGTYPDVLTATIAAYRAGQAPHIAQIFEVGTGTMLAAGKATKQVWDLAKETGVTIDPKVYIASVRGYYSLADGRMASMPFNSSTAVMWINRDAFRKAGLDPAKPPATWPEVAAAAQAIKAKNAAEMDPARAVQRAAQPSLRHQGRRIRGAGRRADDQQPAARQARRAPVGDGEGRHLQIRRPRQRRGSAADFRSGRHSFRLVWNARRPGEERQVRLGGGVPAV
jgi:hypothetical protein